MDRELKNILHELTLPELNSPTFANDFKTWTENVRDNFEILVSAPYLKGDSGANIESEKIDNTSPIQQALVVAIRKLLDDTFGGDCTHDSLDNSIHHSTEKLDDEKFNIFRDDYNGKYFLTAPYFFFDQRIKQLPNVLELDNFQDKSLTIYGECTRDNQGEYIWKLVGKSTIPTLYYDEAQRQFCWSIDGTNTGIIAQGLKGEKGDDVEPIKIVIGYIDESESRRVLVTHEYISNYVSAAEEYNDQTHPHGLVSSSSPDFTVTDGSIVLVMYSKNRPTLGTTSFSFDGVFFGIFHAPEDSTIKYVTYYANRDLINMVNKVNFRDQLNSVGVYSSSSSAQDVCPVRGLYELGRLRVDNTPISSDITHMAWVKKPNNNDFSKEMHVGVVTYGDTSTSVDPITSPENYSGSSFNIDYEMTAVNKLNVDDKSEFKDDMTIAGDVVVNKKINTRDLSVLNHASFRNVEVGNKYLSMNVSRQNSDIESEFVLAARVRIDSSKLTALTERDSESSQIYNGVTQGIVSLNITMGYIGYKSKLTKIQNKDTDIYDPCLVRACNYPLSIWVDVADRINSSSNTSQTTNIGPFIKYFKYLGNVYRIEVRLSLVCSGTNASEVHVLKIDSIYIRKISGIKSLPLLDSPLILHQFTKTVNIITGISTQSRDSINILNMFENNHPTWNIQHILRYQPSTGNLEEFADINLDGYYKSKVGSVTRVYKHETNSLISSIIDLVDTKWLIKDLFIFPEGVVGYNRQDTIGSNKTYSGLYHNGSMVNNLYNRRMMNGTTSVRLSLDSMKLEGDYITIEGIPSTSGSPDTSQIVFDVKIKDGDEYREYDSVEKIDFNISRGVYNITYKTPSPFFNTVRTDELQLTIKTSDGSSLASKSFKVTATKKIGNIQQPTSIDALTLWNNSTKSTSGTLTYSFSSGFIIAYPAEILLTTDSGMITNNRTFWGSGDITMSGITYEPADPDDSGSGNGGSGNGGSGNGGSGFGNDVIIGVVTPTTPTIPTIPGLNIPGLNIPGYNAGHGVSYQPGQNPESGETPRIPNKKVTF